MKIDMYVALAVVLLSIGVLLGRRKDAIVALFARLVESGVVQLLRRKRLDVPNLKKGDPVLVLWEDICGTGGWCPVKAAPKPMLVSQLGYFLYIDKKALTICQGFPDDDPEMSMAPTAIPVGAVRSIKKVRL